MRPETIVFAKFESKGRPKETTQTSGQVIDIAKWIAKQMLSATMGHKIQITIGRTQADVDDKSSLADSMAEFESFLDDLGLDDNDFSDGDS